MPVITSRQAIIALILAAAPVTCLLAQQHAVLSEAETEKLRDTQDPGKRIEVYLELMQSRLTQFDSARSQPPGPAQEAEKPLERVLRQYVQLDDEMKDWIQYQYGRDGDMRGGLQALLDRGPKQLTELRQVQQMPESHSSPYSATLSDAIADLEDTLNGATEALSQQRKQFGALKTGSKAAVQSSEESVKEEKKRIKEEEKLRKKERKQRNSSNSDNN